MLYLFYGSDRNKALEKALVVIEKKVSEKSDAVVFKIDAQNISKNILSEMCGGQGLFEQKYIVHIKDVLQEENGRETIFDFLKDLQSSENIFIRTDGEIPKKDFNKIEKYLDKSWEHILKEKSELRENIFNITNYLLARDKKNLWIEYQKLRNIFVAEEIHGTLFWCLKNIMLAAKTKTAAESGLKPFVFSNSKKALQKFSQEELEIKFWNLTKILGDSTRGEGEGNLDLLLEKWILEI